MKIILSVIILNIFIKVYCAQFNHNINNNGIPENYFNFFNLNNKNNNEQNKNLKKREIEYYYFTYDNPINENHLNTNTRTSNDLLNQYAITPDQKSRATESHQIIQLTSNRNPFTQNQFTYSYNNVQNQNGNSPAIQYKAIEIHNPITAQAQPQGRSFPAYYFNNDPPKSNNLNSNTPFIGVRFDNDDEVSGNTHRSSENYRNAKSQKVNNLNSVPAEAETFQYKFNEGWSIHEAVSVDNIVIPHLEDRKYSKYSTPYAPEADYHEKFYSIYNHVEHQTKQDLSQYERESLNDDFNGRSIVAPGQYPHMAAIGFLSNEETIEFKCGGSLISKDFVITAAHCGYLNGETPIIVKLGIINLKFQKEHSEPQRQPIKEIIIHPSYNSTMHYHDIALLKLQAPVEFTKFVRPILLWSSDDIPYERVYTMGYGSTSFAKAPTNILTELSLSLIPLKSCKEILPSDEKAPKGIVESQICGRDLERNRDTCQGDSGGPLQLNFEHRQQSNKYRYYLVGIISYGEFCGSKKPGVYTRVSSYCRWIASVVWPNFEM